MCGAKREAVFQMLKGRRGESKEGYQGENTRGRAALQMATERLPPRTPATAADRQHQYVKQKHPECSQSMSHISPRLPGKSSLTYHKEFQRTEEER